MSRKIASAQSAPWASPSNIEAVASSDDRHRGADREPDHRVAQGVVVGAGEHEEGDVGDPEDAEREREGEAEVAERVGHAEGDDQQRRHRGEDDQPHRALLGVDHAGQPGVADPGPPEHAEHQQALGHPLPGRVVGHQRRALGDREDEDEVEEELQRRDPLAFAPSRAQPRARVLAWSRHAGHPCNSHPGTRSNTVPPMGVALVTGASTGIGAATAVRLSREPGTELVLVARREELLRELAESLPCPATYLAVDLTEPDAPARVLAHVEAEHDDRLDLLVNNAGAAWRGGFAETGYAHVQRHMELNFDAVVRLTEALLPLLRASAPSAIVNVASTAGRVSRARTGAYSASKFALIGWTDSLYAEERPHGVHVGMVLPGFVATEGFPATELREKAVTRWIVSKPEKVAEAIYEVGPGGKAERYVPRPYALAAVARILEPAPRPPRAERRRRRQPDDQHRRRTPGPGLTHVAAPSGGGGLGGTGSWCGDPEAGRADRRERRQMGSQSRGSQPRRRSRSPLRSA